MPEIDDFTMPLQAIKTDPLVFYRCGQHLGGLSKGQIVNYEPKFGPVDGNHHFGANVWHGLGKLIKEDYWRLFGWGPGKTGIHMECMARKPWLGVFVVGDKFSKLDAVGPLSGPGVGHQYPAYFYLTEEQDAAMLAKAGYKRHLCKNEDVPNVEVLLSDFSPRMFNPSSAYDHDEYHCNVQDNCKEHHRIRAPDEPYLDQLIKSKDEGAVNQRSNVLQRHFSSPPGTRLLEFESTSVGGQVIMICLKIALGISPPWYVGWQHVRLWAPAY